MYMLNKKTKNSDIGLTAEILSSYYVQKVIRLQR